MVTTEPSAVAPVPSTAIPSSLNVITAPYVVGLSVVGVSVVVGSSVTAGVFVVVGSSVTAGIFVTLGAFVALGVFVVLGFSVGSETPPLYISPTGFILPI